MQKTIQTTTFHTQIALSRRINLTLFACLFLVWLRTWWGGVITNQPEPGSEPVLIRFEIRGVPSNYDATYVQSTDWRPGVLKFEKSRFEFRTGYAPLPAKRSNLCFIFCCASTNKLQGRRIEERWLYILPHKPNKTKKIVQTNGGKKAGICTCYEWGRRRPRVGAEEDDGLRRRRLVGEGRRSHDSPATLDDADVDLGFSQNEVSPLKNNSAQLFNRSFIL